MQLLTVSDILALQKFVDALNESNSSSHKIKVIQDHPEWHEFLLWLYDKNVNFGVTSTKLIKYFDAASTTLSMNPEPLRSVLDGAAARADGYTGHALCDRLYQFFNHCWALDLFSDELLYNIIDKDLKCRINLSLIEKAIHGNDAEKKSYSVALAKSYDDHADKVTPDGSWFVSRKLDGLRCLVFIEDDSIVCMSRTGKEFHTLDVLKRELDKLPFPAGTVLDGELCIVDENGKEDFTAISSEYNRKNHTIERPKYFVFDMLTRDEFNKQSSTAKFSDRLARLQRYRDRSVMVTVLPQVALTSAMNLQDMLNVVVDSGGEGLILRKNAPYKGKRSADILKVKKMQDAEFKVIDIISANISYVTPVPTGRMIPHNGDSRDMVEEMINKSIEEEMMSSAVILFKGNRVGVGSGWTIQERIRFHKNPSEIIGKVITVQYFAESQDVNGKPSLRFPTVKVIHGKERVV